MRKLYTTLCACLCAVSTAFAAENVYTIQLTDMTNTVIGEYQQEITFNQANSSYTFVNFLGSECNFTIKIEPQGSDDLSSYNRKKVVATDGITSATVIGGEGFTINGFAELWSKPFTLDGKDAIMLENPAFYTANNYVTTGYVEGAPTRILKWEFFIVSNSKTYKDGAWGDVVKEQYYHMPVEVPFALPDSGLDDIEVENNAPVEYFNLQGMPVSNPAAGQPVIRRQGSKVSKVIIR